MSASPNVNPGYRNLHQMHRTPISNPASSTPRSASMFSNATINQINNSVFTNTTNISSSGSSLDLLHKSVAPNAILNSGGRADEVRCHPGTREEVIGLVEKSIAQQYTEPQMLWLSGPAGAGKSAIIQTVAERCKDRDVPHANFFFFRADSSRKDARPFVATIMHQIIKRYPSVGATVEATLTSDPLLFRMGVQQQFHDLLHNALATLHDTLPSLPPLALLIDGLDECDSENKTEQRQLLQALDTLLIQMGPHVRVVIASRVEPQISMAFGQLRSQVNSIFLDEKYAPEKDILRFVTAEFNKIKKTHYLAHKLGPDWPSALDVHGIVSKSSGQFIFAATVMRFIMFSPASPILNLQKAQGLVPPNKNSPFAHLDTVYAYIIGQVEDPEAVKFLLAIRLLGPSANDMIVKLMTAYQSSFSEAVVDSCLSELAPLVSVKYRKLEFFHASFPDFLQDETRSKECYINMVTFCTSAFPMWWQNRSDSIFDIISLALKKIQQPTCEITATLMEHAPRLEDFQFNYLGNAFLQELHRIYAPEYIRIFNQITSMWASRDPSLARYIPQNHFQATSQRRASKSRMDQLIQQSHSSTSLTHSPSRQIRPADSQGQPSPQQKHPPNSQRSTSTSQARSSAPQNRLLERQSRPPIHQIRSSTIQTCPPNLKTRQPTPKACPPSLKTRPPSPKTGRSTPKTHPSTSQARPAPSQMHGFVRHALPTTRKTDSVTLKTHPSTPKSRPSTSQAQPASLQVPQSARLIPKPTTKTLLSTSQTRPTISRKRDEPSENGIPSGKGKSAKRS